jgi:DNA-binding beta-propeller fold protein YncE
VANLFSNKISVIDSSSNTVIATISVEDISDSLEFNPFNKNIYVSSGDGTISVIDSSNRGIARMTVSDPRSLKFNSANNNIYVSRSFKDTVSVIKIVIL